MKQAIGSIMQPRNSSHFSPSKKLLPVLTVIILVAIFVYKADIFAPVKLSSARSGQQNPSHDGTFHENFTVMDGGQATMMSVLSLDKTSSSLGFESKEEFLFGNVGMRIKLAPAGATSTYYMSSEGEQHDKIEIEFMGNSTGNPYTLHTNVFVRGKGEREQRFFLWFDPTRDFHNYTIVWNPRCIIFYVDDIPLREFKNLEELGAPYPNDQPMRMYLSLGYADQAAARGSSDLSPSTTASYSNFSADACIWSQENITSSCDSDQLSSKTWLNMELDVRNHVRMQRIQKSYKTYDYCWDKSRFPHGPPPECGIHY